MNHWRTIARLLRRSLITLALALLALLVLYVATFMVKDQMQTQSVQKQQEESALQASLLTQRADLVSLQSSTGRFNLLRQQGLLDQADRAAWAEQLVASSQRAGVPQGALSYTMLAPKPLADDAFSTADAAAPTTTGPLIYDLQFELKNSHEEELLALLHDYRAHVKGLFRVQACSLENRTEQGLLARCTLRFFNLLADQPAPAAQ